MPLLRRNKSTKLTHAEELTGYLEAWKQAVAVQQHFNEICWKIRGLALTALTAVLGVASLITEGNAPEVLNAPGGATPGAEPPQGLDLTGFELKGATAVLLVGALVWLAFFFVDAHWYHRLLKGAVEEGRELEKTLGRLSLTVRLTARISAQSPSRVLFWPSVHSTQKLNAFYLAIAILLLILTAIVQFSS